MEVNVEPAQGLGHGVPVASALLRWNLPKEVLDESDVDALVNLHRCVRERLVHELKERLVIFVGSLFTHFMIQSVGKALEPRVGQINIQRAPLIEVKLVGSLADVGELQPGSLVEVLYRLHSMA